MNIYKREQAKLESVRTLLNGYDKGTLDREHFEAGITHLFLPRLSRLIHRSGKVMTRGKELMAAAYRG